MLVTVDIDVRLLASADELALLTATCNHDAAAFGTLYDRYHGLVFRVADRMLADSSEAEDIVQSVFMSIWKSPPDCRGRSFSRWIHRVTHNRVLDALRARNARREATWPENMVAPGSLDDLVDALMEGHRVRRAIEVLPDSQRLLIELGFFGERSHAELAELTRLPLGTVKTRIRSGLQKLRSALSAPAVAV